MCQWFNVVWVFHFREQKRPVDFKRIRPFLARFGISLAKRKNVKLFLQSYLKGASINSRGSKMFTSFWQNTESRVGRLFQSSTRAPRHSALVFIQLKSAPLQENSINFGFDNKTKQWWLFSVKFKRNFQRWLGYNRGKSHIHRKANLTTHK